MTDIVAWLRAHPELAYLCFLLVTGLVSEAFRKRPPNEEAALRDRYPRAVALRDLARGLGWDGPKIRGALALLLLGRPLLPLDASPPTPRDPGLYPPVSPPPEHVAPDSDPERTPRP
jgi:hypothetical protein